MIETRQLILQIIVFIIALWLGLYLIGRNWRDERLRLAGGGLVAYAIALGLDTLALVIVVQTDISLAMLVLLLTILTAAIATQTLSGPFQAMLDQLLLFQLPQAQEAQATFRAAAEASTRLDYKRDPGQIEMSEFVRLTRRALSHMGNLPKLASNPLTQLPIIETRLTHNGRSDHTLERAAQLKALLTESISRLKPSSETHFGTTDAWRHYNAVYFPYVRGLRPYSRRRTGDNLNESDQQALSWFQREVPQRTLYNWQNAAAQLIARDLRERAF